MAIIHKTFLQYLLNIFTCSRSESAFYYDPFIALCERCIKKDNKNKAETLNYLAPNYYTDLTFDDALKAYNEKGIIGLASKYFENKIVDQFIDSSVERKIYTLKNGFVSMPATKMRIIMQGFGHDLKNEQILKVFKSYGQTRDTKNLSQHINFTDVNNRVEKLKQLINDLRNSNSDIEKIQLRYLTIRKYVLADKSSKNKIVDQCEFSRGLFFHYWNSFKAYGFLGLLDRTQGGFRKSKIGFKNEAKIVIDKVQYPKRKENYYIEQLRYKQIEADGSTIRKIFSRWQVNEFKAEFVSNLSRLENDEQDEQKEVLQNWDESFDRYVFKKFFMSLKGLKRKAATIDAPGLFVLWIYLERLDMLKKLQQMHLATSDSGFCWFDLFLLNIARIFYGIPTYTKTSLIEEPSLRWFCMFEKLPCNDSFLNGLESISEVKLFDIQKYLINQFINLGLIEGRRLAFDFHQIDLDVEVDRLRGFGKGPSPKKKICYNGFRPHICWDIDTNLIVVAEFRKGSARGTRTFQRFVKDFLLTPLKHLFEKVYVDSEYTGKDVWNFILNNNSGMGASLVACLKQNFFVKKYRDEFLAKFKYEENFWHYYDDDHVISSKTFELKWQYKLSNSSSNIEFSLDCVVKKNIKNGKLRCFGTSTKGLPARKILEDYSARWSIENAIKDLVTSYYLDKCPGTNPHLINVHFFCVSFCKQLYRLIQNDLKGFVKNEDGSLKTLQTMRELLFRQGPAELKLNEDTLEIHFLNDFSISVFNELNSFYEKINELAKQGLSIIGGLKVKFFLKTGGATRVTNGLKKVKLELIEN